MILDRIREYGDIGYSLRIRGNRSVQLRMHSLGVSIFEYDRISKLKFNMFVISFRNGYFLMDIYRRKYMDGMAELSGLGYDFRHTLRKIHVTTYDEPGGIRDISFIIRMPTPKI